MNVYNSFSENFIKAIKHKGLWQNGRGKGFKLSKKTKAKMSKAHFKPLLIYKDGVLIYESKSVTDAAQYLGKCRMTIHQKINGSNEVLKRYKIEYK